MKKFTPEFIEKAKKASTSEELIAIAKENGIELDAKQAGTLFGIVNTGEPSHGEPSHAELSDDDLDTVAGGNGVELDLNDQLRNDPNMLKAKIKCPYCGGELGRVPLSDSQGILVCLDCGSASLLNTLGF